MRFATCIVITLSLSPVAPTAAQQGPTVPGARVRLWLRSCSGCDRPLTGTLLSVWLDSVSVQSNRGVQTWPLSLVDRVDLPVAERTAKREGAAIGAALGALGAAVAWHACTDQGFMACFMYPSREVSAAMGAAGGVVVGYIIGSLIRIETWAPAPMPSVRIGLAGSTLRVGVAF